MLNVLHKKDGSASIISIKKTKDLSKNEKE
jgi:hypothetical protein